MQPIQLPAYTPYAPQPLHTIEEAAKIARISQSLLRQLIATGNGPAVTRLGRGRGRVLIGNGALIEWIARCTENAA